MIKKLNQNLIFKRLEENAMKYAVIELAGSMRIIITEYGGRVLGPFYDEKEEGILWVNQVFSDSTKFNSFQLQKSWNLGGDRLWIAPEFHYNVRDKNAFDDTYTVQADLDPGNYCISEITSSSCVLNQDMKLELYNCSGGVKQLRLDYVINKIENPLRDLKSYHELMKDVTFAGYEQLITLKDCKRDSLLSQIWNLTQLKPGGLILIPTTTRAEYMDYYEPADHEHLKIMDNHVQIKLDGEKKFKVGFKAVQHFGRAAYLCDLPDQRKCLLIKCFFTNPSTLYSNEAVDYPGIRGYSFDIYHDDGRSGSFTELECYGQPIGGTFQDKARDQIITWLFLGKEPQIRNISKNILGL